MIRILDHLSRRYLVLLCATFIFVHISFVQGQLVHNIHSWQSHLFPHCEIGLKTPQNFTKSENDQGITDFHITNIESNKPYIKILIECGKTGTKFTGNLDSDIKLLKNLSVGYDQYILPIRNTAVEIGDNITSESFRFASGEDAHTGVVTVNQYYLFYLHQNYVLIKLEVLDNDSYFVKIHLKDAILNSLRILD